MSIKAQTTKYLTRYLSLFRYPGGKTWLVPIVRSWLATVGRRPRVFVEPFAGGAAIGLTVAAGCLADKVFLCELDANVAAVWEVVFGGSESDVEYLSKKIVNFNVTLENVLKVLNTVPHSTRDRAFQTIVKNRMHRAGIMAPGAGLMKMGEAGKGLNSRWYPETLVMRIKTLRGLRDKIEFKHGNAFDAIRQFADDPDAFFFVDPPYTIGGKKAGRWLYTHNDIDHEGLFALMAGVRGLVMMTYDDTHEVRWLSERFGFCVNLVRMKTACHVAAEELLLTKAAAWTLWE